MCSAAKNNREVNKRFSQKQQSRNGEWPPLDLLVFSQKRKGPAKTSDFTQRQRTRHVHIYGCRSRSPDPVFHLRTELYHPHPQVHTHHPWDTPARTHLHVGSGSVTGGKSIYQSTEILMAWWAVSGDRFSLDSYGLCLVTTHYPPAPPISWKTNRIFPTHTDFFLLRWLLQKSSSAATVIKNYIPYTNRFHPVPWSFSLHAAHIFFYGHPFLLGSSQRAAIKNDCPRGRRCKEIYLIERA